MPQAYRGLFPPIGDPAERVCEVEERFLSRRLQRPVAEGESPPLVAE